MADEVPDDIRWPRVWRRIWRRDNGLTLAERAVLSNLLTRYPVVQPGQRLIADDTAMTKPTVSKAIARLEEVGLISRKRRTLRTSDDYTIDHQALNEWADSKTEPDWPSKARVVKKPTHSTTPQTASGVGKIPTHSVGKQNGHRVGKIPTRKVSNEVKQKEQQAAFVSPSWMTTPPPWLDVEPLDENVPTWVLNELGKLTSVAEVEAQIELVGLNFFVWWTALNRIRKSGGRRGRHGLGELVHLAIAERSSLIEDHPEWVADCAGEYLKVWRVARERSREKVVA